MLAHQQLLGDEGGEATEQVPARVHHHQLLENHRAPSDAALASASRWADRSAEKITTQASLVRDARRSARLYLL